MRQAYGPKIAGWNRAFTDTSPLFGISDCGPPQPTLFAQARRELVLPPLKWSSLKYGLAMEEDCNGKEETYG